MGSLGPTSNNNEKYGVICNDRLHGQVEIKYKVKFRKRKNCSTGVRGAYMGNCDGEVE